VPAQLTVTHTDGPHVTQRRFCKEQNETKLAYRVAQKSKPQNFVHIFAKY